MNKINDLPYHVIPAPVSVLGEGPLWDAATGSICWVDILSGTIHTYQPGDNKYSRLKYDEMLGSIALSTTGGFVAAFKSGIKLVDRNNGSVAAICHPEEQLPDNRYNDGKCDPAGRFWVGSMSLTEEPCAGSLYRIDTNGQYAVQISGVSISNGMAWSPDQTVFYFIDTPSFRVLAFDYDQATGQISNRRVALCIPESEGFPDGMSIDTEGMLWIAHWDGWQVARWDPFTGKKIMQIRLPAARITSCTFGGDQLQDLYITSAKTGLNEEQQKEQPLAGSLFVIPGCGFQGMPAHAFDPLKL